MKTTRKGWLSAIASTGAVFGLVALFAFTGKDEVKRETLSLDPVTYYYTEFTDADAAIQNPDNWSEDQPEDGCGGETYLCEVVFDGTTYPSIEDFLEVNDSRAKSQWKRNHTN